jgi:hypothetical protein
MIGSVDITILQVFNTQLNKEKNLQTAIIPHSEKSLAEKWRDDSGY